MEPIVWLILLIGIVILEFIVPGPTAIWFGAGVLASYIVSLTSDSLALQLIAFFVATIVVALLLRPVIRKWKSTPAAKTNIDALIGKTVQVIETVDNYEETGMALLDGQEWTARSVEEDKIIPEGACGVVREICGVKLMLEQADGMNK